MTFAKIVDLPHKGSHNIQYQTQHQYVGYWTLLVCRFIEMKQTAGPGFMPLPAIFCLGVVLSPIGYSGTQDSPIIKSRARA